MEKRLVLSGGDKRRKDGGLVVDRCWGHFISYAFLSNPLCILPLCCWGGGREFEEIINYTVEQGKADECLTVKFSV